MLAILLLLIAPQTDLLSPHGGKAVVLLFVRTDCPVSNRYAPDIRKLHERYSSQGIDFHLIYSEPGLTAASMERHRREYGYTIPGLLDPNHQYVSRAGAQVTPEAAVFAHGQLIYSGRIDDRYLDIGKAKGEAKRHDLEEILVAVVAGKSVKPRQTKAIGCAIERVQ